MKNKILLAFITAFFFNTALANYPNFEHLIQEQSKQIEMLSKRLSNLENELETFKANLNKSNTSILSPKKPFSKNIDEKNSPPEEKQISSQQDKTDYDIALSFLKEERFANSETKFSEFITNYPESHLQSNATFWYAETFYRRGMYNKAAINYLQSYKKFPKGIKAPDALLKLSYSLASLNKNQEACIILKKLESEFPKRSISSIKRAENARTRFHCN